MPELTHGGSLEEGGKESPYKHLGALGCGNRSENVFEGETKYVSSLKIRQHNSIESSSKDGGHHMSYHD